MFNCQINGSSQNYLPGNIFDYDNTITQAIIKARNEIINVDFDFEKKISASHIYNMFNEICCADPRCHKCHKYRDCSSRSK